MTSEYQEISSNKLLEKAKNLIGVDDIKSAEFYLKLMKYSSNSESIGAKLQSLFYLSNIFKKKKDEISLIAIGRRIIKWNEILDFKKYNSDVINIIIIILFNCTNVCDEKNKLILACWFLFLSKTIIMENVLKDTSINEKIKIFFPKILKKLNEELNDIYFELKPKKSNLLRLSEQVEKFLQSNKNPKFSKGEAVYLINSQWLKHMIEFSREFSIIEKGDQLFVANSVCLLNFDQSGNSLDKKGYFPASINNYILTRQKKIWEEKDEKYKYTNIYLRNDKDIMKKFDLVNEDIYNSLKFYFGNEYEIKRYCIDDKGTIEYYLLEIRVLFLNEYLREKSLEELVPHFIQIPHNSTVKDLIDKIQRCFISFAKDKKFEDYDYQYKMFLLSFKKKEIIEMIISYSYMNKVFKFKGESINENEDKKISEIFKNDEDVKKSIIICEAISKNSIVYPFLKKVGNEINCSLCNFVLSSDKIIRCLHCTQGIYCSDNCKNQDHQHISFHKKIQSLYEASLKTEEIQQINIQSFFDGKSRHGLVGLKNQGNVDFLLTAIQALSHCTIFTKFFLSNNYLDSSGKAKDSNSLVGLYAELINLLWVGSNPEVSPNRFRNLFFSLLKDITNASHIDSFDMIVLILDKLHEELNSVKQKPEAYFYEEQNGESDLQACVRWWKTHTSMNKSIIIDLFQGQSKMQIKCAFCKNISITFPPFLYLSLPIPDKDEMVKIHFKVFQYDLNYKYVSVDLFDINNITTIKDIKKRIREYKIFSKSKIEAFLFKDTELVQILPDDTYIYDYVFTRYNFSDEEFIDYEISFIEVPDNPKGDLLNFYITPITFEEEKGYFFTTKRILPLTYSKVFTMNQKLTLRDLTKEIFKYYRRSMDDQIKHDSEGNLDESYYVSFYQKINNDNFIENEFNKFNDDDQKHFELYFDHNFPKSNSWFFSGPSCEYCKSNKNNYCKITLPLSTPLREILNMQSIKRNIFILVDFTEYKDNFSHFYSQLKDDSDPRMCLNQEINIYDCFDIYKREEKLTKEKDYICPYCSRKIEPFQQVHPYKAPTYLIINIQRFKKKFEDLMDMLNNRKNETMIGFPLSNLDLTSYFPGENEEILYDLCSIACHKGNIKHGHCYAIVKNENEWYEIDDDKIKKIIDNKDIVNNNAFVLIYQKRVTEGKKKLKEEEDVLNLDVSINSVSKKNFGKMKDI